MWKMMKQLVLLLFAVGLLQSVRSANITPRIVGGTAITIANAPYMVSLWYDGVFVCGGALVSQRHVATAAQCVKDRLPANFRIKAGVTQINAVGVNSGVTKIMLPSIFNFSTMDKDVAVIKSARAITGPNIRIAPLCSSPMLVGDVLRVSGWGSTSENSNLLQNQLRAVKLPVISREKCQSKYINRMTLTRSMMCAAKVGKDSCIGDSGGPAMRSGELCGIVSWGVGCARPDFPGVYTNVYAIRSFIETAMLN